MRARTVVLAAVVGLLWFQFIYMRPSTEIAQLGPESYAKDSLDSRPARSILILATVALTITACHI